MSRTAERQASVAKRLGPRAGFTMVELLVAVAVALIVTLGIYELYTTYVRAFIGHDRVVETQQSARIAIDTLTQDLILAGYKLQGTTPAITLAADTTLEMELYNERDQRYERIRYRLDGTSLRRDVYLESTTTAGTWDLEADISAVLLDDVVAENPLSPALTFSFFTQASLETASQAGTAPAALDVSPPFDADDPAETGAMPDTTNLLAIRQVRAVLTVRSAQPDPVSGRFIYRTLQADVKPRNAGLMR